MSGYEGMVVPVYSEVGNVEAHNRWQRGLGFEFGSGPGIGGVGQRRGN